MARHIDADKLKKNIRVNLMPNVDADGTVTVENAERYFLNLIDKTSTADVAEVKHGEWETELDELGWNKHTCTNCGYVKRTDIHISLDWNYCPHCGAKMDGGKAE